MTPTLEEIEHLVALTKQDTEEAWLAADILDKNNQFRDWLIQKAKELQLEFQREKDIEKWEDPAYVKFLEDKVKELEGRVGILTSWDKELQEDLRKAEAKVKSLETDLALNASMLARQCDLSREAETQANKYCNACKEMNNG